MPTQQFNQLSEITFQPSQTDLKVLVNGNLLGTFNNTTAATLFITQNGSAKAITFKPISNAEYTQGNTNNVGVDTVYYNQMAVSSDLHIENCGSNGSVYKLVGVGWQDDVNGQGCVGNPKGFTHFFNISADGIFKAKMEQVTQNGQQVVRLVARYNGNIMAQETVATAVCYSGPYCYYCN